MCALQLRDLQKPELQQLAAGLPDVVLSGRADSTTKKYLGAFQRWKVWAESMEIVPTFPVKGMHLALYMQHLNTAKHSRSAVEEVVHALAWVHKMAGIESPTESPLVQSVLEGLRRILSKPKGRHTRVNFRLICCLQQVDCAIMWFGRLELTRVCYELIC